MARQRRRFRPGVTLIEVGVTIALLAVAMGLIAQTLSALYRAGHRFEQAAPTADIELLLGAIRQDARRARSYSFVEKTLRFDGARDAEYSLAKGSATRVGGVPSGGVRRFRLPDVVRWEVGEQSVAGRPLLQLDLLGDDADRVARLVVEVGRDQRTVAVLASPAPNEGAE